MKPLLLLVAASCLLITACQKPTPEKAWRGTFTAFVDGDSVSFAVGLKVNMQYSSLSKSYSLRIAAYDTAGGNEMEVQASDTTNLVAGQYCADGSAVTRRARLAIDEKGQRYPYMNIDGTSFPATIIVNVLQEDRVQGEFFGDVYLLDYIPPNLIATSVKKKIAKGVFDLRLQ